MASLLDSAKQPHGTVRPQATEIMYMSEDVIDVVSVALRPLLCLCVLFQ